MIKEISIKKLNTKQEACYLVKVTRDLWLHEIPNIKNAMQYGTISTEIENNTIVQATVTDKKKARQEEIEAIIKSFLYDC